MARRRRRDNTNKTKLIPKKIREATLFVLWLSIPLAVKNAKPEQLVKLGYDIDDDTFMELRNIKTKLQFAAKYGVSKETISDWVKSEWVQDQVDAINKQNVKRFIADINHSFIVKTIQEADAPRVKLFKQLFEGFIEKSDTNPPEVKEALKSIQNNIATLIRTQKKNK